MNELLARLQTDHPAIDIKYRRPGTVHGWDKAWKACLPDTMKARSKKAFGATPEEAILNLARVVYLGGA